MTPNYDYGDSFDKWHAGQALQRIMTGGNDPMDWGQAVEILGAQPATAARQQYLGNQEQVANRQQSADLANLQASQQFNSSAMGRDQRWAQFLREFKEKQKQAPLQRELELEKQRLVNEGQLGPAKLQGEFGLKRQGLENTGRMDIQRETGNQAMGRQAQELYQKQQSDTARNEMELEKQRMQGESMQETARIGLNKTKLEPAMSEKLEKMYKDLGVPQKERKAMVVKGLQAMQKGEQVPMPTPKAVRSDDFRGNSPFMTDLFPLPSNR